MHAYRILWEDEAKNREVEIFVDYVLEGSVVAVHAIRPVKVTCYDPAARAVTREMGVHTSGGRELLVRQYEASREATPTLAEEIFEQHQRLAAEKGAVALE